jgi:hypothetical protein
MSYAANPVQGARVGWMLHQADGDLLLASSGYTFKASMVNIALLTPGSFGHDLLMFP